MCAHPLDSTLPTPIPTSLGPPSNLHHPSLSCSQPTTPPQPTSPRPDSPSLTPHPQSWPLPPFLASPPNARGCYLHTSVVPCLDHPPCTRPTLPRADSLSPGSLLGCGYNVIRLEPHPSGPTWVPVRPRADPTGLTHSPRPQSLAQCSGAPSAVPCPTRHAAGPFADSSEPPPAPRAPWVSVLRRANSSLIKAGHRRATDGPVTSRPAERLRLTSKAHFSSSC